MQPNFYGTLTSSTPNYTVTSGFITALYDTGGKQNVTVQSGGSLVLLGASGSNTISLHGNAAQWTASHDGSTAIFIHSSGDRVEIPAILDAQTITFADKSAQLQIDTTGQSAAVKLGTQVLTTSLSALNAWDNSNNPVDPSGSTDKALWSLVMPTPYNNNMLVSDGTANGTDYLNTAYNHYYGQSKLVTTPDMTKAVYWNDTSVYSTDGSLSGTVTLSESGNLQLSSVVFGNQLALISNQNNAQGFITDGTTTGTKVSTVAFGYNPDSYYATNSIVDSPNSIIWTKVNSAPYGSELATIRVGSNGLESAIVKDINPGSSSGLESYSGLSGAKLPDGRLVFAGNDGVHGAEPWVSDGTESGTFMLADLLVTSGFYLSNSSSNQFMAFGDRVAFTAQIVNPNGATGTSGIYYGNELAFTDGTLQGTTWLDIYPGQSSSPTILGVVGDLLYFTATALNTSNVETKGIFSTNGSSFNRLADVNGESSLLALTDSTAYFNVSDSAHGNELWALTLSNSTFGLVKDILPGSGSGLARSSQSIPNTPFTIGDKLVFTAYTTATTEGFFISDGTNSGTVQIGNSVPTHHVNIGNKLVFADSQGVHAITVADAAPVAIGLVTGANTLLSGDSDQAFFLTASKELYASDGSSSTQLASNISKFKVVAENAIYAIQENNGIASLWFSDGTEAGTRYIEELNNNAGYYDMANAVAIKTVGLWDVSV